MLARGHRLRIGQEGIVGHVAARGEALAVLDVDSDTGFHDNPELPETCSEMALPLQARGEIIGVLDVQSVSLEAFSGEDVAVLQTLADQLAVAINNAQLFQQAQESLEAERRAYADMGRQAWQELLSAYPALGFVSDDRGTSQASDLWELQAEAALQLAETMLGENGTGNLIIPIKIWGQVIGVIDACKPEDAGAWAAEEIALMETLTEQLGVALESARLYHDTRRRAAHERIISEATTHMRETLDVETVLKTAAEEIFQALDLSELEIRMTTDESDKDQLEP
jgi:GAF domain-containing protein